MFEVAPIVIFFEYLVIAILGAVIALVFGVIWSTILKLRIQEVTRDALLGAFGSVVTVIACAIVPFPRNTISRSLGPGLIVQTTLNRFQHPYALATVVTIILPALHHFLRLKSARERNSAS